MTTEAWKIEQYQVLAFEARQIRQVEVVAVPLVIMALEAVSKDCKVTGVPSYTEYNWMRSGVSLVGNSTKFSERCCISELREGAEM